MMIKNMKNKVLLIVFILLLTVVLFFCFNNKARFNRLSSEEKAEYVLNKMTLDEKIAQMLVIYYTEDNYDDTLQKTIKEVKPGGFILMNDNITTYDKTLELVVNMQKDSDIPMIISIDQEGGNVQRLQNISDKEVAYIPSMYYVGKMNDSKLAYELGKIMAKQLRTIGVNLNFAPVVDINNNPNNEVIGKRSFGNKPSVVINMALGVKKGLEDLDKEKVLKIAKKKSEELKVKANELVELAKEKGTPVLEGIADDLKQKTISVAQEVINKLEEK